MEGTTCLDWAGGLDRARLEELWEQATELPDAKESPLAIAIIGEAVECGDTGQGIDPSEAIRAVLTIARDCEDFAAAIGGDPLQPRGWQEG